MFFRAKLILIFAGTVAILLVIANLLFIRPLVVSCKQGMVNQVLASLRAVAAMHRSDELAIRSLVSELASRPRLRQAMTCDPQTTPDCLEVRHRQSLGVLEEWFRTTHAAIEQDRVRAIGDRSLQGGFRQDPTLLIATDPEGTVLARYIGDVSDWYGPQVPNLRGSEISTFAVVSDALLEASVQHDIIPWQEGSERAAGRTLTLVAAAPVHTWLPTGGLGPVTGVVLVGFPITNSSAEDKQTALGGPSLAYLHANQIVAASDAVRVIQQCTGGRYVDITGDTVGDSLDGFLQQSRSGTVVTHTCEDRSLVLARSEFAADRSGTEPVGFLLIGDPARRLPTLGRISLGLPAVGVALLLLGLVALLVVVNRFLGPLERIDHGIQQVIAGNRDYVWTADSRNPYHAEMAQALNAMSAVLQNKPAPDDEPVGEDKEWASLLQFAEVEITGQFPSLQLAEARRAERRQKAEVAAREPLAEFHRRLFDEYNRALDQLGGPERTISFESFVGQVQTKAESYKESHGCRDVRFEVVVKADKVVLKPIPIR